MKLLIYCLACVVVAVDALAGPATLTKPPQTTTTTAAVASVDAESVLAPPPPLLDEQPSIEISSSAASSPDCLEEWREFDSLRASNLDASVLAPFFRSRPRLVAARLIKVSSTLNKAKKHWEQYQDGDHLCQSVSSLGPVAVKIGQTLSERPDIVGEAAAEALKTLKTNNAAFGNDLAMAIMEEELGRDRLNTMFQTFSKNPVACASLGQVYKGTLHDGREVAVKVQRPDAMAILALDAQCFRLAFKSRKLWQRIRSPKKEKGAEKGKGGLTTDEVLKNQQGVGAVIDKVARDILDELDYTIEAENNVEFRDSLSFLGFVTTPTVVLATERVIITEWVQGRHLSDLTTEEGLRMTRMAIEACTASMTLTGFVHADPHEGNMMLHDDGSLVFMDFGLMSRIDQNLMESFARGISALLSEDWTALTDAFVDVGFVRTPITHRSGPDEVWRQDDPNFGLPELTSDLQDAIETTEGGKERFGALVPAINQKLSPRWLVFTPPSVLLLIRTYLTLEGIAAKVDPKFNIYEMAMPWAVRKSLSPSTEKGINVLRTTLMTEDNRIQWDRLTSLALRQEDGATSSPTNKMDSAKKAAMNDAVGGLLGSTEGRPLRRALVDLDTSDLVWKLIHTQEGRMLLRKAADVSAAGVVSKRNARKHLKKVDRITTTPVAALKNNRPTSQESLKIQEKKRRWKNKVVVQLVGIHIHRQLRSVKGFFRLTRIAARFGRMLIISIASSLLIKKQRDGKLPIKA